MKEVCEEELDNLGMHGWYRIIMTNCGSNVVSAFEHHRGWDWLRCGCHLLHNVVMGASKLSRTCPIVANTPQQEESSVH